MSISDLPVLNAALNTLSAVFLALGYIQVRRKNLIAHRNLMIAAFITSTLFLISYITYHYQVSYVLKQGPTVFRNPPWFRPVYLLILLTHTVLAAAVVPMAIFTLWRGLRNQVESHRKLARWTWPVWMYVSVTGVLIYLLLYQIFPQTR
jgi:putative membrane protein